MKTIILIAVLTFINFLLFSLGLIVGAVITAEPKKEKTNDER